MEKKNLMEKLIVSVGHVPDQAEILALKQYTLDELDQRVQRLLGLAGRAFDLTLERGDRVVRQDHTVTRLPRGAQAFVYHASGAMRLLRGLKPMEVLFTQIESRERLMELVEGAFKKLNPSAWIGQNQSLVFERLWQIKAAALDREGKAVPPVLCRVVGAYRHKIGDLPVLGPASLAIKLASGGLLDSVSFQIREFTGELLEKSTVLRPEQATLQILAQLETLTIRSKVPMTEVAEPRWMRFGYLSLPKRKAQRLLAPVYLAAIEIRGREDTQSYLLALPATEKTYLPLAPFGLEASPASLRRNA